MSVVQELFEVTKKLFLLLQKEVDKNNREARIEQVNQLLEQRESMIAQLKGPYSDEEQKLGQEIINYNARIDHELKKIKIDLQQDLKKIKQGKTTTQKYSNPYQSLNTDGRFFDKRN